MRILCICNFDLLVILCCSFFKFTGSFFFRFCKFILEIGNTFIISSTGIFKRIFHIFGKISKTAGKRRFNIFNLLIKLRFVVCNIFVRFFIEFLECVRLSAFSFFCSICKKVFVFAVQFSNFALYILTRLLKLHPGTPYFRNSIFRSNTGIIQRFFHVVFHLFNAAVAALPKLFNLGCNFIGNTSVLFIKQFTYRINL